MCALEFDGFIRNLTYSPQFSNQEDYKIVDFQKFDVNEFPPYGFIKLNETDKMGLVKWVSPKRTRSFPFARLYNIYGSNTKIITIIPIIKDEGADSGNNDRINAITFSWMNLLNIYIILGYYKDAKRKDIDTIRNSKNKNRENLEESDVESNDKINLITEQILDNDYIKKKISEISLYKMTALHWNTKHFQDDFVKVWNLAVESYRKISSEKSVKLHSIDTHLKVLKKYMENGAFNIDLFKANTNERSKGARQRESKTEHVLESLSQGKKGIFNIKNYLGGNYYLTCDEIFVENGKYIIQESKNASDGKFPGNDDIKDGLFKLILFSNIDKLQFNKKDVDFSTRLKLTGHLDGKLTLPNETQAIDAFIKANDLHNKLEIIYTLNNEARINNISIHIEDNKKEAKKEQKIQGEKTHDLLKYIK